MAKVIVLNGVSSSGKSSLARALQEVFATTLLHVEMDAFLSFLPNGHEFKPEWFELKKVQTKAGNLPRITNGPRGQVLLALMRNFVVDAAQSGIDMVVDEVCHAAEIDEYRRELAGHTVRIVKVHAPLEIVEVREKERGDRLIGLSREQVQHLHAEIVYDLEIDTSSGRPVELASKLLASLWPD